MTYSVDQTAAVLNAILAERTEQVTKWGEQTHVDLRWLAILAEEFGEVAKEVESRQETQQAGTASTAAYWLHVARLRHELVQVAAVATAWLEQLPDGTGVRGT